MWDGRLELVKFHSPSIQGDNRRAGEHPARPPTSTCSGCPGSVAPLTRPRVTQEQTKHAHLAAPSSDIPAHARSPQTSACVNACGEPEVAPYPFCPGGQASQRSCRHSQRSGGLDGPTAIGADSRLNAKPGRQEGGSARAIEHARDLVWRSDGSGPAAGSSSEGDPRRRRRARLSARRCSPRSASSSTSSQPRCETEWQRRSSRDRRVSGRSAQLFNFGSRPTGSSFAMPSMADRRSRCRCRPSRSGRSSL